eukprot:TRINITY_DN1113_c0_g1_i1.p1 TRINITY_DN1113_c0_g1~~TRINITY_DN1113_c0_g1_i1.p1  ORF type:complete len:456 (+),score=87.13 TRINITY_DN1113_c0_g1_i1:172-1539(+)
MGGRFEVNLDERLLHARYWIQTPEPLRRSLWCCNSQPYEERESDALEAWFASDSTTAFVLAERDVEVIRNRGESEGFTEIDRTFGERPVTRGGVFTPTQSLSSATAPIECLVLTVHGIGESLWSKSRYRQTSLVEYTNLLRDEALRQIAASKTPRGGRLEFLPIEWYHLLHDDNVALTDQLTAITLPSIPLLRTFSNDAVADVLFYTSDVYRPRILKGVAKRLNHTVELFFGYNPHLSRDIPISLVGHSLGAVILYDLLAAQCDPECSPELRLKFAPVCCFQLGSPLGLFLTVRGSVTEGFNIFPSGTKFFNIVHLNDPVAYRVEPLVIPDARRLPPRHVPHHTDGGVRTHIAMRSALTQLWRVPQELFQATGKGWYAAYEIAFDAIDMVASRSAVPRNDSVYAKIEAQVKATLGHRLDWVLQEVTVGAAMTNAYLSAIVSHCSYFQHPDVAGFV